MEVNGIVEGTGTDPSVEATFKRPGGVRAAGDPKTTTHAKPERTPGTLDRQTDRQTDRNTHVPRLATTSKQNGTDHTRASADSPMLQNARLHIPDRQDHALDHELSR